jgi:predicted DNA-binding transcriptional regulator AlpA
MAEAPAPDTLLHVAGRADKRPKGPARTDWDGDLIRGLAEVSETDIPVTIRGDPVAAEPPDCRERATRDVRPWLGEPAKAPAPDVLLNTCEAAQCLGVSESFLAKARMQGTGPPYRKLGRSVRYAPGDLNQYLLACSRTSTADQQAPLAPQRSALPQARKNIPPPKGRRAPA